MDTKHTPGPWREFRDDISHDIMGPQGIHVASMESYATDNEQALQDANAALIAAAPDLLAALDAIINHGQHMNPLSGRNVIRARAAIAKARGG